MSRMGELGALPVRDRNYVVERLCEVSERVFSGVVMNPIAFQNRSHSMVICKYHMTQIFLALAASLRNPR